LNTILIIIIIGVLSTVFSKGKGKGKRNNQPSKDKPFSANSFDEFRTLFQNQPTNQVHDKTETVQSTQMDLQPEKYPQINQDAQTSQLGRTSPQKPKQQKRGRAKDSDDKVMENKSFVSERLDAEVLINGVIWSEILGEPRSKKPYSFR
jgi:hypothetical protein